MKNKIAGAWRWLSKRAGFERNSRYVSNYLNDANLKSAVYMSLIMVVLEIWIIARSLGPDKSIMKKTAAAGGGTKVFLDYLFSYTSLYWLLLLCGLTMLIVGLTYFKTKDTNTKGAFMTTVVMGICCVLYSFLLLKEYSLEKLTGTVVNIATIVIIYVAMFLFGLIVIVHGVYKWKKAQYSRLTSNLIIISFAVMCLSFGIKISYWDFFSTSSTKMILCFLMMALYVACLLIWKPYISVVMLVAIFGSFYFMLDAMPEIRVFVDGDKTNYITYVISLAMVCISIYNQRLNEALKDEELERIAREDDLTGINNYRHFLDVAKAKLADESVSCEGFIYLFFNIENFKNYNDTYGFAKGNELLISFARGLEKAFDGCPVARYGDDHYVAMTRLDQYEQGIEVAKSLLEELRNGLFMDLKVGGYIPASRDDDPRHSIDRARYACGFISEKHGICYKEFTSEMEEKYSKRQYIINNIDKAVSEGYIQVYYQPVVWSVDKTLCGCEALARWIDPHYGFLSPGEFIPVLEELRLIDKLDRAIFEIVCRDLSNAFEAGEKCVPVSVNFSRLDFELMDAVGIFEELVERYRVPKDYLHVEITESALTDDMSHLRESIEKLHNDGFAIWLDDFGSGYSSLNVLKSYRFDLLKIDMAFLRNFSMYPKTKDILLTIVELANRMGMKTLTEGVEAPEQSDYLQQIGCGRLQGYLYGKPIPLATLKESIENGRYIVSDNLI